jgi:hypothetical protein
MKYTLIILLLLIVGCGKTTKQGEEIEVSKSKYNYSVAVTDSKYSKSISNPSTLSIIGTIKNLDKVDLKITPGNEFWITNERDQDYKDMQIVYNFNDETVIGLSKECTVKPNTKVSFRFYYEKISESEVENMKLYWGNKDFKILLSPHK